MNIRVVSINQYARLQAPLLSFSKLTLEELKDALETGKL
jgi:hypothetical protein